MEAIEVSVRYTRDGKPNPIQIKTGNSTIPIQQTGRRWTTPEGKHLLAMDYQHKTYHLFLDQAEDQWYLIRDISPSPGRNKEPS